ncbi:MAG: RNA 2',3'-cyclic phosphodiesterase [Anaerolineaceae bacterium]
MHEMKRLFFAIELNSSIHLNLAKIINSLREVGCPGINWVRSENIHLTLKFLGDTPTQNISVLTNTLTEVVTKIDPYNLSVVGTGCFPSAQQPRVLWAGVHATEIMLDLQHSLDRALAEKGFPSEKRPFSPHLTLARVTDRTDGILLRNTYQKLITFQKTEFGNLLVDHITLFQSTLTKSGAIYTPIERFRFNKTG